MSDHAAVTLAVFWPLLASALVILFGKKPNLRDGATTVVAFGLFYFVLRYILPVVNAGGRPGETLVTLFRGNDTLGPISLAFEVEPLGMLFALVASGLWGLTSLYAFGYMRGHHEDNQTRFFTCFPLAIFGALGVAFAANLFTLFVFYELITLSTYPLVTHSGTAEARKSGRIYLGILMGTSVVFFMLAMLITYVLTGTTDFRDGGILAGTASTTVLMGLLALFAFGTGKAALMPFHRWLPAAMVAPTPVSALLHAVAVVKAGVFTILKVCVYIFGIDLLADTGISQWLCYVAAFTILSASIVALTKDNLKARLAYSTISQLGYISLAAFMANDMATLGGGLHILMHAVGKITLFFCAGAIMVGAHKKNISEMDGLGRCMPAVYLAFLVGSFSIIGVPPLGGSWSKWYLLLGSLEGEQMIFMAVFMISSLLSIGYLMPVVARGFFAPTTQETHDHHGETNRTNAFLYTMPPVVTAIICVVIFFYSDFFVDLLWPILGGGA